MSQQSPISQSAADPYIDVIDSKLATLESRLSSAATKQASSAGPDNSGDIRRVLDNLQEPAIVHAGGTVVYANLAAARQYGNDRPRELFGIPFLSLIHPDYRTVVKVRMAPLERWPDRDASAKVLGLATDGSEHTASIRMSSLSWRGVPAILSLYDNPSVSANGTPLAIEDMTWEWRIDTDVLHVGPGFQRLLNLTDSEALTGLAGWNALVHHDDMPTLQRSVDKYIAEKDNHFEFEIRIATPEEDERWMRLTGRALRNGDNAIDRLTGMAVDVSAQKYAETALVSLKHKQNKTRRILADRTAALAAREDELDQARRLADASNVELAIREQELAEARQLLQDTISELTQRHRELDESSTIICAREATVANLNSEVGELREMLRSTNSDLGEREQQLEKTGFLLTARTAELNSRAAELTRAKESLEEQDAQLARLNEEIAKGEDAYTKLRTALAKRDDDISNRDRELARLGEAFQAQTSTIAVQGKELADTKSLIETITTTLADRERELEEAGAALKDRDSALAARNADLEETRERLDSAGKALSTRVDEMDALRRTLEAQTAELDERNATLAERDSELSETAALLSDQAARITALEMELVAAAESLDARSAAVDDRDAEIAEKAQALTARVTEIAELKVELATLAEHLDARSTALEERDSELSRAMHQIGRSEARIAEQGDELEALKRALDANTEELTAQTAAFAEAKHLLDSGGKQLARQEVDLAERGKQLDTTTAELSARNEELGQAKKQLDIQSGELERLRGRIDFSSHIQSQFLAGMSHELLTPLNAIKGFGEVISQEMFGGLRNDQYREYATDIVSSADRLRHMIAELLELSRITEQKADLREECLDVQSVVRDIRRRVAGRAEDSELVLGVNISIGLPALRADGLMVRQMLLNLVSNAIKCTDPGGMIEIAALSNLDGSIALSVRDTGAGIPEEAVKAILVPFGPADSDVSRTHAGNGLGLTLARAQIELHGGRLEIDSAPGNGTTVTLHFPAGRSAAPETAESQLDQPDVSVPVPHSGQADTEPAIRPKTTRRAVS